MGSSTASKRKREPANVNIFGGVIAALYVYETQLQQLGFEKEAKILNRAMEDIWKSARSRYADGLKCAFEEEGYRFDQYDQEFLKIISVMSKADITKMLKIVREVQK